MTNACSRYQIPSLGMDHSWSHFCVRIIITLCIKVDQLFALKSFLGCCLLQCELSVTAPFVSLPVIFLRASPLTRCFSQFS